MPIPYHPTTHPPPSTPPSSTPSKWGPYSGAGDFTANIVIILITLFCALVLAIALNAIIRHLLCALRHQEDNHHQNNHPPSIFFDPEKQSSPKSSASVFESFPTEIFSAGTKLAGSEAPDCAICLVEFIDGDRVRVLQACNHGFHVECVERWLASRNSCPTCRTSCKDSINIEVV